MIAAGKMIATVITQSRSATAHAEFFYGIGYLEVLFQLNKWLWSGVAANLVNFLVLDILGAILVIELFIDFVIFH